MSGRRSKVHGEERALRDQGPDDRVQCLPGDDDDEDDDDHDAFQTLFSFWMFKESWAFYVSGDYSWHCQPVDYSNNDQVSNQEIFIINIQGLFITSNQELFITSNQEIFINNKQELFVNNNQELLINNNQELLINNNQELFINNNQEIIINNDQEIIITCSDCLRLCGFSGLAGGISSPSLLIFLTPSSSS